MADDEIIEPGWLHFPGGGVIEVHSLWHGQVCYAAWAPGAKDAVLMRRSIAEFVHEARRQGAKRAVGRLLDGVEHNEVPE